MPIRQTRSTAHQIHSTAADQTHSHLVPSGQTHLHHLVPSDQTNFAQILDQMHLSAALIGRKRLFAALIGRMRSSAALFGQRRSATPSGQRHLSAQLIGQTRCAAVLIGRTRWWAALIGRKRSDQMLTVRAGQRRTRRGCQNHWAKRRRHCQMMTVQMHLATQFGQRHSAARSDWSHSSA